jgi:hypothetical protein
MEYTSVSNPVWVDAAHTAVTADVVFPHLGDAPVKFVAAPYDVMDYGRELFESIVAGQYGAIAEHTQG